MVAAGEQMPSSLVTNPDELGFVHLHLHTQYSMVDGLVRVPELMKKVRAQGMPAVALTDVGNLFAMVKFYKRAIATGVKPIIGVEVLLSEPGASEPPTRLILLCQNTIGYRNLTRLITRGYMHGQQHGLPLLDPKWIDAQTSAGLIALSGGIEGDVARAMLAGNRGQALAKAKNWLSIFEDRFYLQIARTGRPLEDDWVADAVELAGELSIPIVATNDVRFLVAEDFDAHEARVCIYEGRTLADASRPRRYTPQQYLRSPARMRELFADLPEALDNSVHIARRCSLDLELGKSYLPEFPTPNGESAEQWLREQAQAGLDRKISAGANFDSEVETYQARLERELDTICQMGFPGYFLIVADFIRWARENSVPVGPGRGSGAGSLVAWVLGITDIDPLEHDLLFERFLNPERVSMPDFDVDFCMDGRDKVIAYVADHYGRQRVSQIITYGTMAAKAVVRDAGRVLEFPYGFVDRIAKLIPFEVGITLEKALEQEPELARLVEEDEEVSSIMTLARSLEGCVRNAGKHAGGVVIAPTELTDFTPLYCEEDGSNLVTQFDKDDVEAAGLVKFDFLGLRTLTIIERALVSVNARRKRESQEPLDLNALPMDDAKTFRLLQAHQTTAVFQLESRGMKDLIKRLRPDSFADLIALVALYRPGPLQSGMVDDYIARKHGVAGQQIDYLHPELKPVLEPTYGVILYQEQVMQIAQTLAGFTLGGADLLRRAMGKKKASEMAKQREIFVSGCVAREVDEKQATYIFDLMEKFAGYGFNKSHSAAYAVLSYHTAWLKAHYPSEFMAAVMSSDMDNTDKLVGLKEDCRTLGLTILPPDVNASDCHFTAASDTEIRYGLGAVKGVGRAAVDSIIEIRVRDGAYEDIVGFCRRIDLNKVNRRMLEALIKAGALDALGVNRRTLMSQLDESLKSAEQAARAHAAGQNDLFGLPSSSTTQNSAPIHANLERFEEWNEVDRLRAEKEALGLYLSGHPFSVCRDDARRMTTGTLGDIASIKQPAGAEGGGRDFAQPRRTATVAGLIFDIRKRGSRTTLTLDDDTGRIDVALFGEVAETSRHLLVKDALVMATGNLRWDSFMGGWCVNAKQLRDIDHVIEERAVHMLLSVAKQADDAQTAALMASLKRLLSPHRGGQCAITVQYRVKDKMARIVFPDKWKVRANRELRDGLSELLGKDAIKLAYNKAH